MPLSITIGLSRKVSRNYQSAGVSIGVTAELDQTLLTKPCELQQQIDALYEQAEQALDRQLKGYAKGMLPQTPARATSNGNAHRRNGNGTSQTHSNGDGHGGGLTASQRRAIYAIAQRVNVDAGREASDLFGLTLEELTLKQASELIDHLKKFAPTENGNGRH